MGSKLVDIDSRRYVWESIHENGGRVEDDEGHVVSRVAEIAGIDVSDRNVARRLGVLLNDLDNRGYVQRWVEGNRTYSVWLTSDEAPRSERTTRWPLLNGGKKHAKQHIKQDTQPEPEPEPQPEPEPEPVADEGEELPEAAKAVLEGREPEGDDEGDVLDDYFDRIAASILRRYVRMENQLSERNGEVQRLRAVEERNRQANRELRQAQDARDRAQRELQQEREQSQELRRQLRTIAQRLEDETTKKRRGPKVSELLDDETVRELRQMMEHKG